MYRLWLWFLQCLGFDPRGIFRYWDGKRYRNGDPMEMARNLWSVNITRQLAPGIPGIEEPFDSAVSRKLIASGIGMQIQQGYAEVDYAVRTAWGIQPLSQGGLTEEECDRLLLRFERYLGDVKKNGNPPPIASVNTDTNTDESTTKNARPTGYASEGHSFELPNVTELL